MASCEVMGMTTLEGFSLQAAPGHRSSEVSAGASRSGPHNSASYRRGMQTETCFSQLPRIWVTLSVD